MGDDCPIPKIFLSVSPGTTDMNQKRGIGVNPQICPTPKFKPPFLEIWGSEFPEIFSIPRRLQTLRACAGHIGGPVRVRRRPGIHHGIRMGQNLPKMGTSLSYGPIRPIWQNVTYRVIFCTLKTISGFIILLPVFWSDLAANRKYSLS